MSEEVKLFECNYDSSGRLSGNFESIGNYFKIHGRYIKPKKHNIS